MPVGLVEWAALAGHCSFWHARQQKKKTRCRSTDENGSGSTPASGVGGCAWCVRGWQGRLTGFVASGFSARARKTAPGAGALPERFADSHIFIAKTVLIFIDQRLKNLYLACNPYLILNQVRQREK
jgi:hypothetical protein